MDAVSGAHHTNIGGTTTGASIGTSYRFLNGITGVEDNDYNFETAVDANMYQGATSPTGATATISALCADCHGLFHTVAGTVDTGEWIRHPTDIALPDAGTEFAGYDPTAMIDYDDSAPVGYTNPALPTRATATVTCISCHRAHATQYDDALRFNYADIDAGGDTDKALLTATGLNFEEFQYAWWEWLGGQPSMYPTPPPSAGVATARPPTERPTVPPAPTPIPGTPASSPGCVPCLGALGLLSILAALGWRTSVW